MSSTVRFWRVLALTLFIAPMMAACAGGGVGHSGVKRAALVRLTLPILIVLLPVHVVLLGPAAALGHFA